MSKIFSHASPEYQRLRSRLNYGRHNGAFYYSQEIVKNIIPNVKTDRNWVTIKVEGQCYDHSIVFIHSNVNIDENYGWMKDYKDLVLVSSNHDTAKHMEKYGKSIFLPLSIDVDYVKSFAVPESEKTDVPCYAGNRWGFKNEDLTKYLPRNYDQLTFISRDELLRKLAHYRTVYAIGRCALEAKVFGAEIKVCDSRYPDPDFWEVIDNKDAAKMLQKELDKIDGQKGKK